MFGFTKAQTKRNNYSRSEVEIHLESEGDRPFNIHLFVAGYLHSMTLALQNTEQGPLSIAWKTDLQNKNGTMSKKIFLPETSPSSAT